MKNSMGSGNYTVAIELHLHSHKKVNTHGRSMPYIGLMLKAVLFQYLQKKLHQLHNAM